MRGLECERVVRASLCESELCLPRFAAAIASCHAASQRAAFRCVPLLRLRRAAALLRASAALRQGYVHNCAHDRVMVQFSRCALLATRRFSLF